MARLRAIREREKKIWFLIKNQSINTQSSNEKVLSPKQSPPTIDTTIDGETLYSNNLSESEAAARKRIINRMQNMTASIKILLQTSAIWNGTWNLEHGNHHSISISIQRKHWKTSIRRNECKSPINKRKNHSKSLNIHHWKSSYTMFMQSLHTKNVLKFLVLYRKKRILLLLTSPTWTIYNMN